MKRIGALLERAVAGGASDIHLTIGLPPMARVRGGLVPIEGVPVLDAETCRSIVLESLDAEQRTVLDEMKELDYAIEIPNVGRFRANAFVQKEGTCAVLRVIPTEIPGPQQIGLTDNILELTKHHQGLVLVTGPTGSGKSTTLACMLQLINQTRNAHILTVEDPIEFAYHSDQCVITQRQVGPHTKSFANALKSALRQDPDVILIGEMRDLETIHLAVTVAETGHLVFGTLHTSDAPHTVDRIIDVFPAYQQQQIRMQLSASLKGVVCQQLLARADGKGRVAAREVMTVTGAVANMIREGKTHQLYSVIESGQRYGMVTLDRDLERLAREGLVTPDEAVAKSPNPDKLRAALGLGGPAAGGMAQPAQRPGAAGGAAPGGAPRPGGPRRPPEPPKKKGIFGR